MRSTAVCSPTELSFSAARSISELSTIAMLSFSQGKQHAMDQSDAVVETIWHMAKASFTANKNQIVLPIGYEKSLSLDVIEELKRRLA